MTNVEWSAFIESPGADKPALLSPLSWKNDNQVNNLIAMIKFFQEHELDEKTRILIYKSCCGSGKCVDIDTLILTNKGIVRIENIVKGSRVAQRTIEESFGIDKSEDNNDRYIGSTVKSLNLGNIKLENDVISNIFDMGENDIVDITTNSGFNIRCTLTHKLIVVDNGCNVMFKEAKDISTGDSVAIALGTDIYGEDVDMLGFYQSDYCRRYRTNFTDIIVPNKMNEDLAELLGYIISEGNDVNNRLITVTNDEQVIRNRICIIMQKFGINSSEIFDYERGICDGNHICSSKFYDFLRYLGYVGGSKNKEIPWSILQSSKRVQIAFLKALFSGDGYIGNENTEHIEYYTTSKKMAEQLHIMLLNIGIFSSLNEKSAICVKKDGQRKDCGVCYRIAISGRYDIMKYINLIGFIQDYKKSRCIELLEKMENREKNGVISYQSRTVSGSYVRLKRIYEEFKKLGKNGKVIKTWKEEVDLGGKIWHVERHRDMSAYGAILERGLSSGMGQWVDGTYSASKRQILKLLKIMKECYYMEDFKYLYNVATSNMEFDTVEDIKTGRSHVCDLTIRDNHSYVGNGFINHNSLTLLHVPKELGGRAIIVTPFRNLQMQYYNDYYKGDKFVMKKDGTRLKVSVFMGRNNFRCRWLEEQYDYQQKIIAANEKFEQSMPTDDNILKSYQIDNTAANRYLPCTKMLGQFGAGRRKPRHSVATQCKYWIPPPMTKDVITKWSTTFEGTIEESYDLSNDQENNADDGINDQRDNTQAIDGIPSNLDRIKEKVKCSNIEYYESVGQGQMGVFVRDEKDKNGNPYPDVCPYYKQFYSYVYSDVIVFNSAKWNLETTMGRKPKVKIEIVDEGDYWLDSQATTIELMRSTIDKIFPISNRMKQIKMDTLARFDVSFKKIKTDVAKTNTGDVNIISAKDYKELFYAIGVCLNEYKRQAEDDDTIEQKLVDIDTIRRYADVASLSVVEGKREETRVIKCYIPYPDKLLEDLFRSSSKNIILTSGTMHTSPVLSNLFGINADNYVVDILNGRKEHPGKLKCIRPHKDSPMSMVKVNYTSWQAPEFRAYYFVVLNYILDQLKDGIDKATGKPGEAKIIVLTPAKKYAEGILKRSDVFVDFAKGRSQDSDDVKPAIDTNLSDYMEGALTDVRKIKDSDIELNGDVLRTDKQIIVSTRMVRGTDLRDNKCRAIVMTKWPVGDISDGYLQSIKKRFGEKIFWEIIKDKAAREAVQYVSRGLRHELDWTYFATVDSTAFDQVYRLFSYD